MLLAAALRRTDESGRSIAGPPHFDAGATSGSEEAA